MSPGSGDAAELIPPFVLIGEAGEIESLWPSLDSLLAYFCLPTDVGPSGQGEAWDSTGRRLELSALSDDDPIRLNADTLPQPAALEARLRDIVRSKPTRFGLLDADAGLDGLLRALWRTWRSGEPYPK